MRTLTLAAAAMLMSLGTHPAGAQEVKKGIIAHQFSTLMNVDASYMKKSELHEIAGAFVVRVTDINNTVRVNNLPHGVGELHGFHILFGSTLNVGAGGTAP